MEFCGHETGDEAGESGAEWVSIGYVEERRVGIGVRFARTGQARRAMHARTSGSEVWEWLHRRKVRK